MRCPMTVTATPGMRPPAASAYWVIDPHAPSLTAWELAGEHYHQVAEVQDDETFQAVRPYPVIVQPSALVR